MITDAQNRPSNNQSLAGAAATTASTDSIDLLTANRNIGRGYDMRAIATATVAFTGGTSVQVNLIQSANADLSSPTVIATGTAVADASAVAGRTLLDVPMPTTSARYIGFQYVTLGTHTTGSVSAHIVSNTDRAAGDIVMNTGR
jgi:hypothetical protein